MGQPATEPVLGGVIPVAPTTFDDDENLDLASQARVIDFLVDARADAVCILANYSTLWEEYLPLIHYENRQCGLRAAKVLLHEGGVIRSEAARRPIGPLPVPVREGLLELARRRDPLVLRWRLA